MLKEEKNKLIKKINRLTTRMLAESYYYIYDKFYVLPIHFTALLKIF